MSEPPVESRVPSPSPGSPPNARVEESERRDASRPTSHFEKAADRPWYTDPPKLVGVLGFVLALATVGERLWLRGQEATQQQLQQLREVTSALADIQVEYLQALTAAPSNIYALGVAKNTKRQMYLQTAASLLERRAVMSNTSSQVLAALGSEWMNDGRYDLALRSFTAALVAPGADDATRPYLLRSVGLLYKTQKTGFTDSRRAADYFNRALALLDKRRDDAASLTWAETVLSEASMDVMNGDQARAKRLVARARERLKNVRSNSPLKVQLERFAAAYERGEQYAETQDVALRTAAMPPNGPLAVATSGSATAASPPAVATNSTAPIETAAPLTNMELWSVIRGQVSGVEMDVSIDGKNVAHVSNLNGRTTAPISGVSPGIHRFAFTNLKAYLIDPSGQSTMTGSGYACNGLFELPPGPATLKANIANGPNGLICGVQ